MTRRSFIRVPHDGSWPTFAYAGVLTLFLAGWHWKVHGSLSLSTLLTLGALTGCSLALGAACLDRAPIAAPCRGSPNLRFLVGFIAFNTLLFALSAVSPFAITVNAGATGLLALVLAWRRRTDPRASPPDARPPELIALILAATAATLWCHDDLEPMVQQGANTVFRLWADSFVHARIISAFAQAHGLATLSDFRMSGTPLYLYHYASYATPAALMALTATSAFELYASFLLPFGIVLTGVAAFALVRSWWGAWPAVAATVAVVLIPDAYQQGFANRYLSYNFMQQVNVAGLYGIPCAALAWIFMIDGCRSGKPGSLVAAGALAALSLFYKAHIFVANALLILLYPCLFFRRVRASRRVAAGAGALATFFFALSLSERFERAPTLRLDGSGAATYLPNLAWNYEPGVLKTHFQAALAGAHPEPLRLAIDGSAMLLLSTFGLWIVVALAAGIALRGRTDRAILWFPALVVANYVAMVFGLALDTKGIGSPDELLNRPLVWAYFVVAAWTGGAVYFRVFGPALPAAPRARVALGMLAVLCLAGPALNATNLQTYPRWPGFETYEAANTVPTCLVAAARFLRTHTTPEDLIQDSENDRRFLVAALSERQAFVTYAENRPPPAMHERIRDLERWRAMALASEVRQFATEHGIGWYLLRPTTPIAWPVEITANPAFACDGYRVIRLAR